MSDIHWKKAVIEDGALKFVAHDVIVATLSDFSDYHDRHKDNAIIIFQFLQHVPSGAVDELIELLKIYDEFGHDAEVALKRFKQ